MPLSMTYEHDFYIDLDTEDRKLFKSLQKSQAPTVLFITCSDSRICPNFIFKSRPGEVFAIRNAGNFIDEYEPENPTNEAITIEFAIKSLRIEQIIICGHSNCGAMNGVINADKLDHLPLLKKKLKKYQKILLSKKMQLIKDESELLISVTKANINKQIEHLLTYPFIQDKLLAGTLSIQGWFYQLENGFIQIEYKSNEQPLIGKEFENAACKK